MIDNPKLIRRFVQMFGCDQARITSPNGHHFLILGWNRNTQTERESGRGIGQWFKDGQPVDFDFVHELAVASGGTIKELMASAKHYKQLDDMKWSARFSRRAAIRATVLR